MAGRCAAIKAISALAGCIAAVLFASQTRAADDPNAQDRKALLEVRLVGSAWNPASADRD